MKDDVLDMEASAVWSACEREFDERWRVAEMRVLV